MHVTCLECGEVHRRWDARCPLVQLQKAAEAQRARDRINREEWSCEGCGKPTRDKPTPCEEGGEALCQVCAHVNFSHYAHLTGGA